MARKSVVGEFYPTSVQMEQRIAEAVSAAGYTLKQAVNASVLDFLENPQDRDRKLARLAQFCRDGVPGEPIVAE